ncbi:response regulator transcription factor [Ilumatobacter sp.]|uniref:response regulator transcription factor n=1 Tax=Ilumatobacter sp. TaxID=1967498 RepID=UPI003B5193EC
MAQTVLVIEDEERIVRFLERGLEAEGYVVVATHSGERGVQLARTLPVDAVILDLMLPGLSGEEVLDRIRESDRDLPIIVLTAKDSVPDRVAMLNAGADDYLSKPFSLTELIARIRARLRDRGQERATSLEVGAVTLDLLARRAVLDGREIDLTAREFSLLETFMRHPGQVLSEFQLLDLVWGYGFDTGSNVVEVYVGYLRKKLRPDVIVTIRGSGYRFEG